MSINISLLFIAWVATVCLWIYALSIVKTPLDNLIAGFIGFGGTVAIWATYHLVMFIYGLIWV